MTNAEDWESGVGRNWAAEWRRTDRSFANLTPRLLSAIAALPGTDIVDVGCGAGELSLAVADARPGARVLGIDISPDLLTAAAARARGRPNLAFALADASRWEPDRGRPDLYMSRHGVMFFADPVAAFAHLARVATPGAHLAFSCFRDRAENPWASELAMLFAASGAPPADPRAPGPFAFSDKDYVAGLLGEAGWNDVAFEPVDFTYRAGEGANAVDDAMALFQRIGPAAAALRALPDKTREAAAAEMRRVLESHLSGDTVSFPAAAWIVTARSTG